MKRIRIFLSIFVALFITVGSPRAAAPNFVIIFIDDQGYGDLSCFGSKTIKTPHIDRLATEGRKFTSFMVASPV
ncbi:MAG: sulfatase-like hydrolase/transferase, partial [Verrucomicrobiota bacterium]